MVPVTRRAAAFDALVAGLQGRFSEGADWDAVVALANRALLTPTLFAALSSAGHAGRLPADTGDYLAFIHGRGGERNRRLRVQLIEVVRALNLRGIDPILLKGSVPLFLAEDGSAGVRITSDLDLAVDAGDVAAAEAVLAGLRYRPVAGGRGLARPEDAGVVELRRSRLPAGLEALERVGHDGLRARVPSPEARALHLFVHDLLKEGDYWRGRIDLRHMHDLAILSRNGVDWAAVRRAVADRRARNALETQLLALERLFAVAIPEEQGVRSAVVRLQHWRRMFCARHPVVAAPLRLGSAFAWGLRRLWLAEQRFRDGPRTIVRRIARTLFDDRARI